MQRYLDALQIPAAFAASDLEQPEDATALMDAFKNEAPVHLGGLQRALHDKAGQLSTAKLAQTVAAVVPFDLDERFASASTQITAQKILTALPPPSVALIQDILLNHVRPAFAKTPHPSLNLSTGRTLARPIGGASGTHDLYDEQPWKQRPGLPCVVLWCAEHIERGEYEKLWHLIVPPMMTFLDDYETKFKVWGLKVASSLVTRVPPTLLQRTGIGALLDKSITQTFYHLHNPETPALLRISIPAYLSLLEQITEPGSQDRLNKLFELLGKNVIGTIWVYASQDAETIEVTVDTLPLIMTALGVSTARFLKALIPQLLHPLTAPVHHTTSSKLCISSLRAMQTLMVVCRPRIHSWREVILTAICRGWAQSVDDPVDNDAIKDALIVLLVKLVEICPTIRQNHLKRIYDADHDLFYPLFSAVLEEHSVQ